MSQGKRIKFRENCMSRHSHLMPGAKKRGNHNGTIRILAQGNEDLQLKEHTTCLDSHACLMLALLCNEDRP